MKRHFIRAFAGILCGTLASSTAIAFPTAIPIKTSKGAACAFDKSRVEFVIDVEQGHGTDDVAAIFKSKWVFLRGSGKTSASGLSIKRDHGRTHITIATDAVALPDAQSKGGKVFKANGVYVIAVGAAIDSEDSTDVVSCRFRYSRK